MELDRNHIVNYVERFLNNIFIQRIRVGICNGEYVINEVYKMNIYEFWSKKDEDLLNDFNEHTFGNDVIGTIFFFLSGYWEFTHQSKLDNYGRFMGKDSFAFKKGIIDEPVVDILVDRISKKMALTYKLKYNRNNVFLTHDIDFLGMFRNKRIYKSICGDIIRRKDIKAVLSKFSKIINKEDPHAVEKLIEINKKYNAKGTFFFMPGIQPHKTQGGYDLVKSSKELNNLKFKISKNGGSVGIHYDSRYLVEDRMISDVNKLSYVFNERVNHGRAHYLVFNITKSFDIFEKNGIKLDSSAGYADVIGFRFGTSYPFRPYNFEENREYNIIEVPLIVMDTTLKSENYMNLSPNESLEIIKKMIYKTNKYHGVFTILWHNTSFFSNGWDKWEWVYEEMLNYLNYRKNTFLSADEIIMNEKSEK